MGGYDILECCYCDHPMVRDHSTIYKKYLHYFINKAGKRYITKRCSVTGCICFEPQLVKT